MPGDFLEKRAEETDIEYDYYDCPDCGHRTLFLKGQIGACGFCFLSKKIFGNDNEM